ncbi:Hpt domain-containing protein [Propionivibrio sp.]|uniref:hybrid sensor histidine kinase/response regulator n=1 Tax=Propionivibrio sp. TaxID=2212460 RepID=UPI0026021227|nr:Hpt domain-containing protein [Propionivibrio sp.]
MNAVTEFDVGPLNWVKSEIDLALGRADQALQHYTASVLAGSGDLTQLKFCRTHLHQVQGALTIVGLDGVTQFAEAVEAMLEAIEHQQRPAGEDNIALAQRALATIGHYLDDLVSGQPNQPLRLLSIYREVQAARGLERVSATDLFFPDLTVRPPRRQTPAKVITHSQLQSLLRQERLRFQRGFLSWLRSPQDRRGISEMLGAVKRIEETQEVASARSFWWVATGFLSALAEDALPQETNVKRVCARIDLQIRRLFEGSSNVAERLMRDALYFVASADSNSNAVQGIKNAYQLQAVIPTTETVAPAPEETVRRRLRDIITGTEEAWNKYCAGTQQSLPVFREYANALSTVIEQLDHTDYRRLAQAIAAAANWLAEDSTRHAEALSMEIATAILLAQNTQENFRHLGGDFAHQVDVTVARIHGCLAGNPPRPGSEIPLLDEMSRQAQEKLLVGQVAKEIQNNLAQIEQVLDGFFRDTEKRADLAGLEVPFRQIAGALTMMRYDAAVTAVRECAAEIKRFSDPEYAAQETDFERVANQLSLIGFFIDTLPNGSADFEGFVRQMHSGPTPDTEELEAARGDASGISVEQDVERQKLETHALLGALKEQPGDLELREEIKLNLSALKNDADLVADRALGKQTKAMLSMLATGESAAPQIDHVMATLKPTAVEVLKPSAETIQLAQASNEEIDAELLGIFLEEANEVLGTIAENLQVLRDEPHNLERLTTIRRSFHTLKGSGRMVGLKDLGETAWAVEQTLNLWLGQELEVGPPILDLLAQAHAIFATWVRHLETHSDKAPDPTKLVALAESLRHAKEGEQDAPALAPSAPASSGEAAASPEMAANDNRVLNESEVLETPTPGAEIITLDFPPTLPENDDGDYTVNLEAIEIADFDFGTRDVPIPVTPPSPPVAEPLPDEAARPESEAQSRISFSPTLYEIFSEEALTHLATLQAQLTVLEQDELTPTPHDMYRAAHTLAGISATVGITPVNRLGLALEHALLRRDNSAQQGNLEALGIIRQAVGEIDLMLSALAVKREPEVRPELIESLEALYPANTVVIHEAAPEQHATPEIPPVDAVKTLPAQPVTFVAQIQQLDDEIDEQLLPIFLEEALDLSQGIATQLRSWRSAPANTERIHTLERLLHTLKGSARMAGAMNLGEITHAIETRVEQASRTDSVTLEVIDEIDNAFDSVLHIIERLQRGETLDHPPVSPVEDVLAASADAPPVGIPENGRVTGERRTHREISVDTEADASTQRATLRVRADLIDRLVNEAGELTIARARIEGEMRSLKGSLLDLTENVIRLRRQLREIEIQAESQMQSRTAQADERHAGFDPLEFDRFTRFQELTRMMAESVNDVSTAQQNLLKNLDDANAAILAQARLNREVQQELMAVRMVPFGSLADRLYRIVRQTSKELNKRANLEIRGSQVELDRSVIDKIGAPLEHMLRNAIAHGLEERDVRVAQGKPDIGEISLALKQEGNEIILTFSDDGAGLDYDRIRARAITAGLLGADEEADTARLADMIFTPGFSTASEVSQVSGRGVGMDVVKTEVSSLGGRIEVISTPRQGTEFLLYIPLTLALTKALLVRSGNKRYAIPSVMIEQVLDLKEAALTRIRVAGAVEWMGNHYPFSYLPHLLGDTQALPEQRRQYWILLLRSATRRIAVQVDELIGNEEIVVKNIGPQLARVIGVDGATVLADGQVVLILNPVALSTRLPVAEFAAPVPTVPTDLDGEIASAALPTVMVVDDSLTVRKFTGRLLAREGYQVITAKDGVDALEQLLDIVPDVMLVDIEMPRMDGFDLTRNVRADARLKGIPIIMITSRIAEKHRTYAFEIGVNDYLGKPYQEDELLHLVANYVAQQRLTTA